MSLNPRVLMKSKTRYFPEHSLLQEAITELMLGLCQDCVTPGDAMPRVSLTFPDRFRVLLGSEAPYLVSDRLKPAPGPWAAFLEQRLA